MAPGDSFRHAVTGDVKDEERIRWLCRGYLGGNRLNGFVDVRDRNKTLIVGRQSNPVFCPSSNKTVRNNISTLVCSRYPAKSMKIATVSSCVPAESDRNKENLIPPCLGLQI